MGTSSSHSSPPSMEAAEELRRNRILSSKLYFNAAPSKVAVIYSPSYDIAFLGIEKLHPFDSSKWGRICQFLTNEDVLDKNRIIEPLEASKDDLLVVHPELYLSRLKSSVNVSMILEVPPVAMLPNCLVQQKVLHPFRMQVGGSILAAKLAKERGWAINVGGGFHHCSAQKGGGFCVYADITLCIQYAFVRLNISRVMIIDLDAHQGNGHETDFSDDRRVYIMDMYNSQIYPLDKPSVEKQGINEVIEVEGYTGTVADDPRDSESNSKLMMPAEKPKKGMKQDKTPTQMLLPKVLAVAESRKNTESLFKKRERPSKLHLIKELANLGPLEDLPRKRKSAGTEQDMDCGREGLCSEPPDCSIGGDASPLVNEWRASYVGIAEGLAKRLRATTSGRL